MKPKTKLAASLLLCPLLALLLAAPAGASTVLGRAYTPYAFAECGGMVVETGIAMGSPSYEVPPGGGVITSWATATGPAAGSAKLKVLRPTGVADQYQGVDEDGPHPVPANGTASFTGIRIPVQGGDVIGLIGKGTNCMAWFPGGSFSAAAFGFGIDPAPGATASAVGHDTDFAVSVTATMEPDADHDGYGDETQDQCPADPAAHTAPCPTHAAAAGGPPGAAGPGLPAADSTPPLLRLRGQRVQRALRHGAVVELARTDEAASLRATAWLGIGGGWRLALRPVSAATRPGAARRLVLRVPAGGRSRLRAALRRGERVRAVVRVRAVDPAGNSSLASRVAWLSG